MSKAIRYLILPASGIFEKDTASPALQFLTSIGSLRNQVVRRFAFTQRTRALNAPASLAATPAAPAAESFDLIDAISEDGVKLISATPEMAAQIRFSQPGLRIVPEFIYKPAVYVVQLKKKPSTRAATTAALSKKLSVQVVRADTKAPLAGLSVIGFTKFATNEGAGGVTNASGKVTLTVPSNKTKYERVYVQHELPNLWSHLQMNVASSGTLKIELQPVKLADKDSLQHFHKTGDATGNAGKGVRVGVIDSGVDRNHPDLKVEGGLGCVPGEPESDFGPSGGPHGSHVAGIIAGRGTAPTGMRGIAPGAEIFSYRVFSNDPDAGGGSFALVKAIQRAVTDKCHVLNMSLGFGIDDAGVSFVDVAVQTAIAEAHKNGVVVIAAAGNDGRRAVNYPGSDVLAVAVAAVGRKGTFPATSGENGDIMAPKGSDPDNFIAAFSNIGVEIDAAGSGVGVVSTVPGGHSPMSGTSMACPAVTGVLARLLSENPAILAMPADEKRAIAIKQLLFANTKTLGFPQELEGNGLPK